MICNFWNNIETVRWIPDNEQDGYADKTQPSHNDTDVHHGSRHAAVQQQKYEAKSKGYGCGYPDRTIRFDEIETIVDIRILHHLLFQSLISGEAVQP